MTMHAPVIVLPTDRDTVRRIARAHAEQGQPMQRGLFALEADQVAYERAYHQHHMTLTSEVAECA